MNRFPCASALILGFAAVLGGADSAFDLDALPEGEPTRGILVIEGSIRVRSAGNHKILEIPGDRPEADACAVLGPTAKGAASIEARILGSRAGRSFPRFGLGLLGQSGFRLGLNAARGELELTRGGEDLARAPFPWRSGEAVFLRLVIARDASGRWTAEGSAWREGDSAPGRATIRRAIDPPATRGQASIWGSPYAGTPIAFDRIKVGQAD